MSVQANPYQLRSSGSRFAAGAQEMAYQARRCKEIAESLLLGRHKWTGQGAQAFQQSNEHLHHDLLIASQAFERIGFALQNFAIRMEQVDQLRDEVRRIENSLMGVMPQTQADQEQVFHERMRAQQVSYSAEMEANAANQQAAAAFQEIAEMEKTLQVIEMLTAASASKKKHSFWGDMVQDLKEEFDLYVSFEEGVFDAVKESVEGVVDMVFHLETTLENLEKVAEHPIDAIEAIGTAVVDSWEKDVVHGDAESRAKWAGHALGEVATAVIGTKGIDKVAKVLKAANEAEKAATVVKGAEKFAGENANLEEEIYNSASATRDNSGLLNAGKIQSTGAPFDQDVEQLLEKYGMTKEEFNRLKNKQLEVPGQLNDSERNLLRNIRNAVPLTSTTIMQKVIHMDEVEKYLNGEYTEFGGFVARAQDVVDLKNPLEIQEELRLDYNSPNHPYPEHYNSNRPNPFLDAEGQFKDEPVVLLRFAAKAEQLYNTPFEFDNVDVLEKNYPFSGSGFAGGQKIIPEFYKTRSEIPSGTEIYVKNTDGSEVLIAKYISDGVWKKY